MPSRQRPQGAREHAGARLHGLDTLRAAAILWVMPYHLISRFPQPLHYPARFGWMGVDLFFVLSGYLIASQIFRPYLQGRSLSLRDFYVRRAYRILPLFYTVLLLYIFVPMWREAPGLQAPWQFATFTENLLIDYGKNQAFSHAWSLCVEEHFYLILPLLTILLMRRPAAWKVYTSVAATLALGIGLRAFLLFHDLRHISPDDDNFAILCIQKIYYPTYVRLDSLLAGVTLAVIKSFRPQWWLALARRGHSLAACGVGVIIFAGWLSLTHFDTAFGKAAIWDLIGYPLLGLGFVLLTASAISKNGVLARVRVPGAKFIATLAFSLYLTHKAAVHLFVTLFPGLPEESYLMLPVYLAVCLAVAGAFYLAVERPFLRLREPRAGNKTQLPAIDLQARIDPAV